MTQSLQAPLARFPLTKFRVPARPQTFVARPALWRRLDERRAARLTVLVASPGAGKTVLLSSWAATRQEGSTAWLGCDEYDRDPVRLWAAMIEAIRSVAPTFGSDAACLLERSGYVSADVVSAFVNDLAQLPAGFAIVADDLHQAQSAGRSLANLVARWPPTAQLVLSSRSDPPLPLHRLRLGGELDELRNRDLRLSLSDTEALFTNFGLRLEPSDLARFHAQSEGWVAALQMAALTLRATDAPTAAAAAFDLRSRAIADYFVAEVLTTQPLEIARFMLETCVLDELTEDACIAVTGRPDALGVLRTIEAGDLFIEATDPVGTEYRYHRLVRDIMRAQLHATSRSREAELHRRAADWFASAGDTRAALRHHLAAGELDRTCPEVAAYLASRPGGIRQSPFVTRLFEAAQETSGPAHTPPAGQWLADPLTGRELEVLRLLPTGLTYVQLSSRLAVSRNTVKSHLKSVYMKLGATTRAEAIERGSALGFL